MGLTTMFRGRYVLVLAVGSLGMRAGGHAQRLAATTSSPPEVTTATAADLPEAPQPTYSTSVRAEDTTGAAAEPASASAPAPYGAVTETATFHRKPASKYRLVVQSDEVVPWLTASDKLKASLLSRITPGDIEATLFSAGWSHLRDSAPHYGSDKGAFGERLGALALKQTSQSFFSYGVYAGLAHTDPRYYVMGPRESIKRRAIYSASRLIVAKSDDGHDRVNWPKLAGIATATALTNLYYPKRDTGFADSLSSFGVSCGSSVLTLELHEFLGDAFRAVRGR